MCACDGRFKILVIDKLGEGFMGLWRRNFQALRISHLRSPCSSILTLATLMRSSHSPTSTVERRKVHPIKSSTRSRAGLHPAIMLKHLAAVAAGGDRRANVPFLQWMLFANRRHEERG